jgi:rhodanese-related sulfurtransferase
VSGVTELAEDLVQQRDDAVQQATEATEATAATGPDRGAVSTLPSMADVPSIGCEELLTKIESGDEVVLVDALSPSSYAHSHLPGAINLPPQRVDASVLRRIPDQNAEIVVYCANPECDDSVETAKRLVALGYTNVRHYPGGKTEWRERRFPLERRGAPYEPAV